jgi:hypothetical protein
LPSSGASETNPTKRSNSSRSNTMCERDWRKTTPPPSRRCAIVGVRYQLDTTIASGIGGS